MYISKCLKQQKNKMSFNDENDFDLIDDINELVNDIQLTNGFNDPYSLWMQENRRCDILNGSEFDMVLEILKKYDIDSISTNVPKIDSSEWMTADADYESYLVDYNRLDPNQQRFVQTCLDTRDNSMIFLTGPGGSGKSLALKVMKKRLHWKYAELHVGEMCDLPHRLSLGNCIVEYVLNLRTDKILTTAPTGIAAIGINGMTYHRALGLTSTFNPDMQTIQGYINSKMLIRDDNCSQHPGATNCRKANPLYGIIKKKIKTLIIDEISMVSAQTMDFLDQYLSYIRNSRIEGSHTRARIVFDELNPHAPKFGGIQMIVMGDLCQLPPVDNDGLSFFNADCIRNSDLRFYPITINGNHRFINHAWGNILKRARFALSNPEMLQLLFQRTRDSSNANNKLRIVTSNRRCNEINQQFVNQLVRNGNPSIEYSVQRNEPSEGVPITEVELFNQIPKIMKDNNIQDNIELVLGSQVMITKNIPRVNVVTIASRICPRSEIEGFVVSPNGERDDIVNGTRGTVVGIANQHYWHIDDDGVIATDESGAFRVRDGTDFDFVYIRLNSDCRCDSANNCDCPIVELKYITYSEIDWQQVPIAGNTPIRYAYEEHTINTPMVDAIVVNGHITDVNPTVIGVISSFTNSRATLQSGRTIAINTLGRYNIYPRKVRIVQVELFQYMPLRCAWAITVHKSQGLTLNNITIEPMTPYGDNDRHGVFYVMLSRVVDYSGVSIEAYNPTREYLRRCLVCNDEIKEFYRNINRFCRLSAADNRGGVFDFSRVY